MTKIINEIDGIDALCYARAQLVGDLDVMAVLLTNGDAGKMLVVTTAVLNALALRMFGGDRAAVLRFFDATLVADLDDIA